MACDCYVFDPNWDGHEIGCPLRRRANPAVKPVTIIVPRKKRKDKRAGVA